MERRRKLDTARPASGAAALIRRGAVVVVFLCLQISAVAQSPPASDPALEQIKQLFAAERWQEIVKTAAAVQTPSADVYFYYGTALARLDRWDEARRAFQAGDKLRRQDERFPVELAGVAFKQKKYGEAAANLRRALKLKPHDAYANDFLGTVYFIQGNLPAALKYWNRVDKPQIANVSSDPVPRLDPVILDRAFAFSRASILRLPELWATEKQLDGLEVFPSYQLDLQAREDGEFDVVFRNHELDGWGPNKWAALFLLLRGLPAQTVYPEYFDFRGKGLNFSSMFRWDANKRRLRAALSGPFEGKPVRHFSLAADLRDENWGLYRSFAGPAPLLGAFKLRREAISADVTFFRQWTLDLVGGRQRFRIAISATSTWEPF